MGNSAIPAGALPEHAAAPGTPHPKRCSIAGSISCSKKSSPGTHRSRIDVLVAAEPGEGIGEGHDHGRQALFADEAIEPLPDVLAEADPIRLGEAAAREAYEI